jgi:outer membrane protein
MTPRILRRGLSALALSGGLLVAGGAVLADDLAARRLTLAEAVALAGKDNPELAIAARSVDVAEARVGAAKAQRLPTLQVEAGVQAWHDEANVAFGPATFTVRDQVTASATVTVLQPITGLFTLTKLVDVERAGRAVLVAQLDGARADVGAQTAVLYLRVMQAKAFVQIAESAVTQLDAQLARAKVLETAGVLGKVDIMRIESAQAQAEQQALSAREGLAQAQDGLAMLLGLPAGATIETVDDLPAELPALPWTEAQAIALAAKGRPELRTARAQAQQAAGAVGIARMDYWPQLAAIAQYQHVEGQALAEADQGFVGVTLRWNVWDWGKRGDDVDQARARAAQARLAAARAVDTATIDVRGKLRAAATKREQLAVAAKGLTTAEEAYRLISARFQAGAATTTDQIDAEADVIRARLAHANARYEYAIALVQLARAVGESPLAAFSRPGTPAGGSR